MDTDDSSAAKAPAKTRGLKPHQIMMLLIGALAVFMIVGGAVSLLEESRLPAAPVQAAS